MRAPTCCRASLQPYHHHHLFPSQTPRLYTVTSVKQKEDTHPKLIYPDPPSQHHSDLASFLSYASKRNLNPKSTVFVGTHYEYTVSQSLRKYGFALRRVGGSSDNGTDLIGIWKPSPSIVADLRVLVQCKAGSQAVGPQHIRELEGTFVGAPPGWRGRGVLGLLVAQRTATKGLREALTRSQRPILFMSCSAEGSVQQMIWNSQATQQGLEGLSVTTKHEEGRQQLVLLSKGEPLPFQEDGKL